MASIRKILNKYLSQIRLEIRRLPKKISPNRSAHATIWNNKSPIFKKYHIGCGSILAKGFLNIDDSPMGSQYEFQEHKIYEAREMPGAFILKYDLSYGIPAHQSSLDRIYHSHFLEHLNRDQGIKFLKDCFYVLEENGIMRFAIPDFRLWCTNYINNNKEFFSWYKSNYLPDNEYHFHTSAQIFTGMLYNHGHQMAYDYESIYAILSKIGFKKIELGHWGNSHHFENLESLEAPGSQRKIESLIIECHK